MDAEEYIGKLVRVDPEGREISSDEVKLADLLRLMPLDRGSISVVGARSGLPIGTLRARAIRHLLAENAGRNPVPLAKAWAIVDRQSDSTHSAEGRDPSRVDGMILVLRDPESDSEP